MIKINELLGWTPFMVDMDEKPPAVYWTDLKDISPSDPFFSQTIIRLKKKHPSVEMVKTNSTIVEKVAARQRGLKPTGFIFHVGRCGSTLVANMLDQSAHNLVLREPASIGAPIQANLLDRKRRTLGLFKAVTQVMGYPKLGCEKNYFIKFQNWPILNFAFIQRAFPRTRSVFIYRDPIEVVVSHMERQAFWQSAENKKRLGAILTGIPNVDWNRRSEEEYCARVIGQISEAAILMANKNALLINYEQVKDGSFLPGLLSFFGLKSTKSEMEKMDRSRQFRAKESKKSRFKSDHQMKQKRATDAIRQAADRWLREPYERLEALRLRM